MKKALLASTALVAMSGAAVAQGVTLTGAAEMGIADSGDGDAMFHQDIQVTFGMSTETDTGLTISTAVDLSEVDGKDGKATNTDGAHGGVAISVAGAFGTVTLGDTDGAFDWALAEVDGAGAIAADHTGHAGFNGLAGLDGGGDGQILRYNNSFGGLGFALSFEQADGGTNGDVAGLGITGGFGDVGLGVGFQSHDNSNVSGASVTAAFGDISGAMNFARTSNDAADDVTQLNVGATYTIGATSVNVNFGQKETGDVDATGFGVAAQYLLGGGTKMQFGYGNSDHDDDSMDKDTWSLGLSMAF